MAKELTKVKPAILSTGAPQWNDTGTHAFLSNTNNHGVGLELNYNVADANGFAFIDFHSTNATYPDYDARIIKDGRVGYDNVFLFESKGEGDMSFKLNEAERLRISSDGKIVANTLNTTAINAGGNKSLVTKEYVDGLFTLSGSNLTINI